MPKKAFVPPRFAPLQRIVAEPITDPAEQAALDKMRRRWKKKQEQKGSKNRSRATKKGRSAAKKRG